MGRRNPNTRTLAAGTRMFHGTDGADPPDWFGFAWFSDDPRVARVFAGADGTIYEYVLTDDVDLLLLTSADEIVDSISKISGLDPDDIESMASSELADEVCSAGYDGWIIPKNYPEGDDILLCDPGEQVEVVRATNPVRERRLANRLANP